MGDKCSCLWNDDMASPRVMIFEMREGIFKVSGVVCGAYNDETCVVVCKGATM